MAVRGRYRRRVVRRRVYKARRGGRNPFRRRRAVSIRRKVNRLYRMIETKDRTVSQELTVLNTATNTNTGNAIWRVTNIPQGTNRYERVGNKITGLRINMKGIIHWDVGGNHSQWARVVIFCDKRPAQNSPTLMSLVYDVNDMLAPSLADSAIQRYNIDSIPARYQILAEGFFQPTDVPGLHKGKKFYLRAKLPNMLFNGSSYADLEKNQIWAVMWGGSDNGNDHLPAVQWTVRYFYKDA